MNPIKVVNTVFALSAFSLFLSMSANAVELTGTVKSESGKPLSGVRVLTYAPSSRGRKLLGASLATRRYDAATDQNGFFKLPSHSRLVYFRRDDLRPLTMILNLSAKRIKIVMEDRARTVWEIPLCSSLADKSKRIGTGFRVVVPDNIMVKKATQLENGYLFGYTVNGEIETMVIWSDSTSLEPSEEYFFASRDFSERAWLSGNVLGYEIRGAKLDGKLWRRVSFRGGAITYQGNSKESADSFDRLIDGMCFQEVGTEANENQ